ncbi:glycoside hydrolase family 76 protein [Mycena alexandri]|uniref:Glycoside hydrolase family 76 protein n=1 Tax=Mycena alexandri TaxID=1745969 RepID=A0AAD6T0N9_9AGAR|nr:glycoside hydrolase family 76 protein [Mycena alexandri]
MPVELEHCSGTLNLQPLADAHSSCLSHYFNVITGQYSGGAYWTDANAIENIHNLMLATGTDEWSSLGDNSYLGRTAILQADTGISLWSTILDGSYDDASWIIMALWKIADYKTARGPGQFGESANTIYSMVESAWDTFIWWSSAKDYKNSVQSSQLRNSQGLFNDGLTSTCANNGQTTWTYNQGVIAAGLGTLYAVTKDATLLTEAEVTLDAAIRPESCDNPAAKTATCNNDQQSFKGIFMKSLQYYLDRVNDPARTAKYAGFIHAQASGVYYYGTSASTDIGSVWYAPSQGGSVFSASSSSSGLAAHIVNAKYGPCSAL